MRRYRWLGLKWGKEPTDLVDAIRNNPYSESIDSGFLVSSLAPEWVSAKYVRKFQFIEDITDPLGRSFPTQRLFFESIDFRMNRDGSVIEVLDPPRSLSAFLSVLSELTLFDMGVASIPLDIDPLLEELGSVLPGFRLVEFQCEIPDESRKVTKRISVFGEQDLRQDLDDLGQGTELRVQRARITYDGCSLSFSSTGVVRIQNDPEELMVEPVRRLILGQR